MTSKYIEAILSYRGFGGCESRCNVMMWKRSDDVTHVLFIERRDNNGTSVTNMSEWLANDLCTRFAINPATTEFYECYEEHDPIEISAIRYSRESGRFSHPVWSHCDMDMFVGTIFVFHGFEFNPRGTNILTDTLQLYEHSN